jgi:AP2 domain
MKQIFLTSKLYPGLVALVDDEDYAMLTLHTWCPFKTTSHGFYAKTCIDGKFVLMHHLVKPGNKNHIDHADRDGLNNTRANLRVCTSSQQNANRDLPPGNASQYRGVTWEKARSKWRARITVNRKDRRLGMFTQEVDAAKAYDDAALAAWGEYAVLNFPEGRCPEA